MAGEPCGWLTNMHTCEQATDSSWYLFLNAKGVLNKGHLGPNTKENSTDSGMPRHSLHRELVVGRRYAFDKVSELQNY